jgi:conjugal transfer mating pair stabilization protein TraN
VKQRLALIAYLCLILGSPPSWSQDRAAAEATAREIGKAAQQQAGGIVNDGGAPAAIVPGFGGTDLPQGGLIDDPEGLASQGGAVAGSNEAYQVIRDPRRKVFDPTTIDLGRATDIEGSPQQYLGVGTDISGEAGSCKPLPPGTGAGSEYFETCNDGDKVSEANESCHPKMAPKTVTVTEYFYYGVAPGQEDFGFANTNMYQSLVATGQCRATGTTVNICDAQVATNQVSGDVADYLKFCRKTRHEIATEYACNPQVPGGHFPPTATGNQAFKTESRSTTTVVRDDSSCAGLDGSSCAFQGETCTSSTPETRIIDGVSITQPCWEWQRDYKCRRVEHANDCATVAANPKCKYDHDECLDDPQEGACKVKDIVYRCTADPATDGAGKAFICSGDLYCINGECTKIEREASTEFKDAVVAIHTLGDMKDQFDPATMTLFNGQKAGCHKPIFGLVNCCAGKTSGLLTVATGGAAIASGVGAIAALATPFLTLFLCDPDEKLLDVKDRMGLCHYVGTYCSEKILFVCSTKRKNYCCYESKLARIIQEQGRAQIGKSWGTAKDPTCKGFTIEEFQQLDLSKMDFTEVYDEFIDAAKVPDEIEASLEIQQKVEEYYRLHTKP